MWNHPRKNKYGNKKIETAEGAFDGKYEWQRWLFLKDAEKRGEISNLRRQVTFTLLPKQYTTEVVHLKTKDKVVQKFAEHPVTYLADFVYEKFMYGLVVEDFKGVKTDVYSIKKKMMLYFHGISIREVKKPTEPI